MSENSHYECYKQGEKVVEKWCFLMLNGGHACCLTSN